MNDVSDNGGRLSFRFLDETREAREAVRRAVTGGLVAVELDGPYIRRVFAGCVSSAHYTYRGMSPAEESHGANSTSRGGLTAPVAAGSIGVGETRSDDAAVRMMTVGRYSIDLTEGTDELLAHCAEATHVLADIEVGAFELSASASSSESVGVMAGLGLTAEEGRRGQSTIHEGVWGACAASNAKSIEPPDACSVPLRARLLQIRQRERGERGGAVTHRRNVPAVELAAPPDAEVSSYVGTYSCGSAVWEATLQLWQTTDGVAGAVRVRSGRIVGRWALSGTLGAAGAIELEPVDPVDVPDGYAPVGFEGELSEDGFEGTTSGAPCGTVSLSLSE